MNVKFKWNGAEVDYKQGTEEHGIAKIGGTELEITDLNILDLIKYNQAMPAIMRQVKDIVMEGVREFKEIIEEDNVSVEDMYDSHEDNEDSFFYDPDFDPEEMQLEDEDSIDLNRIVPVDVPYEDIEKAHTSPVSSNGQDIDGDKPNF